MNTRLADRRIATFNQVRAQAFLLDLQDIPSLEAHLDAGRVAALMRYDAEHGTAYVESLRAYLEAMGDVNVAAKRVHVHRNTLRYRLGKLCELVELDLEDPAERLVCELQLWFLSGRQGSTALAARPSRAEEHDRQRTPLT
jgi:DNA-binding PucR family transcriptional regulator